MKRVKISRESKMIRGWEVYPNKYFDMNELGETAAKGKKGGDV